MTYEQAMINLPNPDLELCKNICMIHKYNLLLVSDAEKGPLHENMKYWDKLTNQVILHTKLKNYSIGLINDNYLMSYMPIDYLLTCVVNILQQNVNFDYNNKSESKNSNVKYIVSTSLSLLQYVKAIVLSIDCGCYLQAITLVRGMIEVYISFSLCKQDKDVAVEYDSFQNQLRYYEENHEYSPEFLKGFKEYFDCSKGLKKPKKINYLHNGWIDIFRKAASIKDKGYTLRDVSNVLNTQDNEIGSALYERYEYCSRFSHGGYDYLSTSFDMVEHI